MRVGFPGRVGNPGRYGNHILRAGPPCDLGRDRRDVDMMFNIECRVGIRFEGVPVAECLFEQSPLGCVAAPPNILIGRFIRGDHSDLGAEFDRQIADGQTLVDRQGANGRAGVFNGMAATGRGSDLPDSG